MRNQTTVTEDFGTTHCSVAAPITFGSLFADVRTFQGGMPIVGHPPCRSWSAFCRHQAKPLLGEKELAPFVVEHLRKCGGVMEHPAHSTLWDALNLPIHVGGPRVRLVPDPVRQPYMYPALIGVKA